MRQSPKSDWRRRLPLLLCAVMLAGCTVAAPDSAQSMREAEESSRKVLTLLMPGGSSAQACARISQQISAVTREELGFDVQLEQLPADNYENGLWQRLMEEQSADVFYLPASQTLSTYVYENEIWPLTVQLKEHEALYQCFTELQWSGKQKHRMIYAVPTGTTDCYCTGFLARADILEELGVEAEQITDFDQLYELLRLVKKTYPDMVPVVSDHGRVQQELGQDPLGDNLGVLLNNRGTTITNLYASEEYAALCNRMYRWYQEGLILKNACLRTESAIDLMNACDGFGFFCRLNSDAQSSYSRAYGGELAAIRLSEPIRNSSGLADSWCLPVQQSLKTEAVDFLQLLYTDAEVARLFVEGDGQEEDPWINTSVNLQAACSEQAREITLQDEAAAHTSPAYGFVVNTSELVNKLDECRVVAQRYDAALTGGYLNPEEAIPQFLQELQAAGIDFVISVKQRQLNDWLAGSG